MMFTLLIASLILNAASLVIAATIGQSLGGGRHLNRSELRSVLGVIAVFVGIAATLAYMAGGV